MDIAQFTKAAQEAQWYVHALTLLSLIKEAVKLKGFALGFAWEKRVIERMLACDEKGLREHLHRCLEGRARRGVEVKRRGYKMDRKQEGVDPDVCCEALMIVLEIALTLQAGDVLVVLVVRVEGDLKMIVEKIEKAVKSGRWLPEGCSIYVIMIGASWKAPEDYEKWRKQFERISVHFVFVDLCPELHPILP
eukprot:Cvel_23784.t1-p1 / transcript=Cvel_23784.t1 / gene=Cvel_23784 / organism=Chromera_velia_CCMP2878 / gene_product=hypothetical protein / transcript_product=hypothetical protein / location=Cvel_scaffold2496:7326-7898(+) / protein_length=191 / sequence_SO=supercontig / SO=protein_coding / is_pseudo=false